ncbi:MAG: hypothetical protein F6K54_30630 [Okeania sp. SIO3B5]|uniref:hypothetical protein n=1 Tax=Okeania sp. SIO3B5 TaxID=2607811 RepID=UPI0013FEBEAB|nr:hypothetical protein [Okeania sp. SIO3B5]NEO57043.1 hypothetical protein [Okeania sp. SIO3B5]
MVEASRESQNLNTTRLLSGSAYRRGILSGFDLLNRLRSSPYKAQSPEATLDLDQITSHAAQAVAISVAFGIVAVVIWLVQLFLLLLYNHNKYHYYYESNEFLFFLVVALNIAGSGIVAYELVYLRWSIPRRFLRRYYKPNPSIGGINLLTRPIFRFLKQQHIIQPNPSQNVITFAKYPFLGAGKKISEWTIAIDRKPSKNEAEKSQSSQERIQIPVNEFYSAADSEVAKLQLSDVQQLSLLFVDGFELNADGQILNKTQLSPESNLPEEQVWSLGEGNLSEERRAYRVYRYSNTERDQRLSYFLRFYNLGSITFVETSTHILFGIDRQRFSLTSTLKEGKFSRIVKTVLVTFLLFLIGAFTTYYLGGYALVGLLYLVVFVSQLLTWRSEDKRTRIEAKFQEEYNYGLFQTFRESISDQFYDSYYGIQDLIMYWKSIDQAVLASIIEMLKGHGVDTSQFQEMATNIINQGVMVSGGNFTANQVTAGANSTSIMSNNSRAIANPVGSSINLEKQ